MSDYVQARLLSGKNILVTGIANDQSIAWGCAKAFHEMGAQLAVTYRNEQDRAAVAPLADQLGAICLPLDVTVAGQSEALFKRLGEHFGVLHSVLHSIAFAPKQDLHGAHRVIEHYNVMGPVKAALEATVRYLAHELGGQGIRVHAISPGPIRTRAASGIAACDELIDEASRRAPAGTVAGIEDVGYATAMLAVDNARLITGSTIYVDGGAHIMN